VYCGKRLASWSSRKSALTVEAADVKGAQLAAYRKAVKTARRVRVGSVYLKGGGRLTPFRAWELEQ
jgi:hypothetical protein